MKRILSLALGALLLAGCTSRPSDTDIRSQVADELLSKGRDRIYEVQNLRKVNGIPRDDNTYFAEVEYDLRFKHNLEETVRELQKETGSIFAAGAGAATLAIEYGDFKPGDMVHKQGEFKFIRTENGWRLASR